MRRGDISCFRDDLWSFWPPIFPFHRITQSPLNALLLGQECSPPSGGQLQRGSGMPASDFSLSPVFFFTSASETAARARSVWMQECWLGTCWVPGNTISRKKRTRQQEVLQHWKKGWPCKHEHHPPSEYQGPPANPNQANRVQIQLRGPST